MRKPGPGRQRILSEQQIADARRRILAGENAGLIAAEFGVSWFNIYTHVLKPLNKERRVAEAAAAQKETA